MQPKYRRLVLALACAPAALLLANCGGDDDPVAGGGGTTATTVSGSVVKGPCSGTTVRVLNASSGAVLATTTTTAAGTYTTPVNFSGDVIIEAEGGTCANEATGGTTALTSPMRSVINVSGASVTGVVTPLTTMAYSFAFGSSTSGVTAGAFNTKATSLASQFQLGTTNLTTTVPVVTGTTDAYGRILRGLSQYMQTSGVTLATLTNSYFTSTTQWTAFQSAFNTAYATANPGSPITFAFNGNGLTISGTGGGGGTGACGVNVKGSVTTQGVTVPLDINYCVQGIAGGSCTAGNASLSQALAGQAGLAGGVNLNYTFSSSCAAGAFTITLQ